jgi:hypothetical protein
VHLSFLSHVSGATPPQLIVVHQLPGAFSLFFIYALLKKVAEEETPGRIVSTWHIAGASLSLGLLSNMHAATDINDTKEVLAHSPSKFNIYVTLPLITTTWMLYRFSHQETLRAQTGRSLYWFSIVNLIYFRARHMLCH